MTEFTRHLPGTFCWPELSTTDQRGAVAFYSALLGWEVNDQPMGPDEFYSMFQIRGLAVGAAYTMRPEEKQMGAPPHWNAYVAVEDVDRAVLRAQELGGDVLAPGFDVFDAGRMAILRDPTGAIFQVWQAGKHIGAHILDEPGSLCWTELTTSNPSAAEQFYVGLFDWQPKHSPAGSPMPYTEFTVPGAGRPSVGMMATPPHMPPGAPSFWLPYFLVANVDTSTELALSLGGSVHMGPQDIPNTGRFAVIADPQGAVFCLFTPAAR